MQIDIGKHAILVVRIMKTNMLKSDIAMDISKRQRRRRVFDIDRRVNDLDKAFNPGHAALELLSKLDNAPDRCKQRRHIQKIRHQIAGCNPAGDHEQRARNKHRHVHQAVKNTRHAVKAGHIKILLLFDIKEPPVALAEFFLLNGFVCEGFDDAHAKQAVLDLRVQLADLVTRFFKRAAHTRIEIHGTQEHNRQQRKDDQREEKVCVRQNYK